MGFQFFGISYFSPLSSPCLEIPVVEEVDAPRYEYRGLMLDVARNFFSAEEVMRVIDVMAMYKMNKLHLHLTDDEGWRIEIPGLPELTEVYVITYSHHPNKPSSKPHVHQRFRSLIRFGTLLYISI